MYSHLPASITNEASHSPVCACSSLCRICMGLGAAHTCAKYISFPAMSKSANLDLSCNICRKVVARCSNSFCTISLLKSSDSSNCLHVSETGPCIKPLYRFHRLGNNNRYATVLLWLYVVKVI